MLPTLFRFELCEIMPAQAFHNEFKDCTMLVVAHRLQTVMDSDLIAVLDAGRVVETGASEM